MAQGLKPSDTPVIVREFETRLLLVVLPVLFFLNYIYLFFSESWCPLFFVIFIFIFIFLATHHPHTCRCLPFCYLHGTPTRHREVAEACGGVQRRQVKGLGELLPLFCVVILVFSFFF